jgi:hypothetical protein
MIANSKTKKRKLQKYNNTVHLTRERERAVIATNNKRKKNKANRRKEKNIYVFDTIASFDYDLLVKNNVFNERLV